VELQETIPPLAGTALGRPKTRTTLMDAAKLLALFDRIALPLFQATVLGGLSLVAATLATAN
jgi:hypothetical protein